MDKHKRTILIIVLAAIFLYLAYVITTNVQAAPKPVSPTPPISYEVTVANLLREVNIKRSEAGVAPLTIDTRLNQSAQLKSDEIARTGVFEHYGSTGKRGLIYAMESGVSCQSYSENLVERDTLNVMILTWMNSQAHKDAMLDPKYDTTGFGITDGAVTEHLCDLP